MSGINSLMDQVILLPDAKMDYSPKQIAKFIELWEKGIPIGEIAEKFWVANYEMVLLVMHCELEGWIQPRDGGLKGTQPRKKRDKRMKGETK
ncbi:hypothetical protein [Bacillus sp. ISL-46]|uniref:hypothetical protein n=1 Tax=Bacillus sp. ISL-46 TaxID=2819129 RepID=UPI001BE8307C|nr:hypothetical protein [Bacillus sp. ISL-46]MBT2722287.1 hypothetical protein [Bacillus sp. ISL-46]